MVWFILLYVEILRNITSVYLAHCYKFRNSFLEYEMKKTKKLLLVNQNKCKLCLLDNCLQIKVIIIRYFAQYKTWNDRMFRQNLLELW
jgi:hypothetical protein